MTGASMTRRVFNRRRPRVIPYSRRRRAVHNYMGARFPVYMNNRITGAISAERAQRRALATYGFGHLSRAQRFNHYRNLGRALGPPRINPRRGFRFWDLSLPYRRGRVPEFDY